MMEMLQWLLGAEPNDSPAGTTALGVNAWDIWFGSPERAAYISFRSRTRRLLLVGLVLLAVAAILLNPGNRTPVEVWWANVLLGSVGIIAVYCAKLYVGARWSFRIRQRQMVRLRAESALDGLASDDTDIPLPRLFQYNRRQLDRYQEISRQQQGLAFTLTQIATAGGFVAVLLGAFLVFRAGGLPNKAMIAGLSSLGVVLSGFLANTFMTSARDADRRMNSYYQEPSMLGRLLVAERIMRQVGGDSTTNSKELLKALFARPKPQECECAKEELKSTPTVPPPDHPKKDKPQEGAESSY